MADRHLYIVFSATPYRIGKTIRLFTRQPYNHVSIALDSQLSHMYSFARRHASTPFYGGFVRETLSRYHYKGIASHIQICRLDVSEAQYRSLQDRLQAMYANQEQYLYNYLSVFSTPFRRTISVKDAYTCIDFIVHILQDIGIVLPQRKYYSIMDLEILLRPNCIYTGPIPEVTVCDNDDFFHAVPRPVYTSLSDFYALFPRLKQ